jgi:hypothetical protein
MWSVRVGEERTCFWIFAWCSRRWWLGCSRANDYPLKYSRREPLALRPSVFPAVRPDGSIDPGCPLRQLFASEVLSALLTQPATVTDLRGQLRAWPACRWEHPPSFPCVWDREKRDAVAPPVVLHPTRGQNGQFMSHSVLPHVERTDVLAWLSSPGTAIPGFPVVEGPVQDDEAHKSTWNLTPSPVLPEKVSGGNPSSVETWKPIYWPLDAKCTAEMEHYRTDPTLQKDARFPATYLHKNPP